MRKRLWRVAARSMLGIAVLVVVALVFGVFYEIRRERSLTERYEPPGELVDIGSHRLHLYCEGSGEPPVLLEAGSGLAYSNWDAVQSGLSRVTRVCSYDRSGLGWSERGPRQPSANQATEELAQLLESSGIAGPWVFVGHSLGGLYAQQFLNLHSENVAALVLLDPGLEDMFERVPRLLEGFTPRPIESLSPLLTLLGLHRRSLPKVPESDPSWVARELHATSKHLRRAAAEWWSMPTSTQQLREARVDWGQTPVLVISAGIAGWPESWSQRTKSEADRVSIAMAKELATRSSQGRYRVLEGSGHGIPWERPQEVIAAVDSIVQQLRQRSIR